MVLILSLLLSSVITYAADSHNSDKKITLRFEKGSGNNQLTLETTVNKIKWAPAIQNCTTDLEVQNEIPLHNVDLYTFKCLSALVSTPENPNEFIDPTKKTLKEIKEYFSKKLPADQYGIKVNPCDALVQADCLEMHPKFKRALASFSAQGLHNPTISKDGIINNLTPDLEPPVAGWLWHTMIEGCKTVTKTKNIGMRNVFSGPMMSKTSPKGGMICMWEEMHSSSQQIKVMHFNFAHSNEPTMYNLGYISITTKTKCALSDDERWLLVTQDPGFINIYDLEKFKNIHLPKDQRTVFSLDLSNLQICEPDIVDIVYNDKINENFKMQGFDIIIHKNRMKKDSCSGCEIFLVTIPILTGSNSSDVYLDRVVKRLALDSGEPLHLPVGSRWSCVRGNLVCVSSDITEQNALLYKDGKLHHCFFDKGEERWMYQIGDKKCDANFELIKGTRCSASGSQYDYVRAIYVRAIPDLFIPYINDVMPMHQQLPTNNSLIEPVFDPHQLCFTEITHTTVKVTYLLPPKLIAMLHFLQNKIDRGNPKVLADTLAIKCYYENNATWHTQCSNILEHVSPYIREKLEEPEENNSSFATSLSSLGWCTIS